MELKALKQYVFNWLSKALPQDLYYHGLHHTQDVLSSVKMYMEAESVSDADHQIILQTGAIMHDVGFTHTYQNHEEKGVEIAQELLPAYGYNQDQIQQVSGLIMATKVPQQPQNHLEQILCDCDLDYLGRDDFYNISQTLFEEWKAYNMVDDLVAFDTIQVKFLEKHHYFTAFAKKHRAPQKAQYVEEIKKRLKS